MYHHPTINSNQSTTPSPLSLINRSKMALKLQSLLFVILSFLFASILFDVSAAVGRRKEALVGGWSPIKDPKDPKVQQIGQFAVTEHNNQAKTNLTFESVVRGETQVVAGTNYRLVLTAKDGTVSNNYEAVVWEKPWQKFRKLTSFKSLSLK
ncbi:unnamed protein product [Ilex paraguariensis]|uniref:Cystatin domain-containing protein n=1 Tax=Ilex paraguariensis TaxID=185542 RepID=A0ABC8UME6_9AQUA